MAHEEELHEVTQALQLLLRAGEAECIPLVRQALPQIQLLVSFVMFQDELLGSSLRRVATAMVVSGYILGYDTCMKGLMPGGLDDESSQEAD